MVRLVLAEPRGFCAGVRRAISLVEESLERFGAPVYVRHEIVHNKHVIADLKQKGAVFIDELEEADLSRPVIFSAHGVSASVVEQAEKLGLKFIDATCPLVGKVHYQIRKMAAAGKKIIIIGKASHPEIIGTRGQIPADYEACIISSAAEVDSLPFSATDEVGFVTQTTLSVNDTKEIISRLKARFPSLEGPKQNDICYATTNRQQAVGELAAQCPTVIIIGSKNSSNSRQLREVALKSGAKQAFLIDDAAELDWDALDTKNPIGVSAGASAPEYLVENLLVEFKRRYGIIDTSRLVITEENVNFRL